MRRTRILLSVTLVPLALVGTASFGQPSDQKSRLAMAKIEPRVVRDLLWVWGNPEMTTTGKHAAATFAQASPAERAQLLGVSNVIMAGYGLPNDDQKAEAWMREISGCSRIVWEIMADGEGGPPFVYQERMAQVHRLVRKYPKIEAVLLDDMSTVKINKGFKPEHIRQMRKLLSGEYAGVDLWGVWYTMTFDREGIEQYIKELDVINLWTWHAKDVTDLEKNVAHCERLFPEKPIVLGLYLYDYGGGRRMPMDLLRFECETALELAHAGRIEGIVFLTITNDAEAVGWVADWIKRVGDQELHVPSAVGGRNLTKDARSRAASSPFRLVSQNTSAAAGDLELKIGDGSEWHFLSVGGSSSEMPKEGQKPATAVCRNLPWTESDGVISPPNERNLHSRAFYTPVRFSDFNAEFEFNGDYRETGTGGAGLVFGALDVNHFYMVYFPWGGQQLRAKHFWAQLVKVDGDGYLRSLKSVWVPGVPSETDRWYKVRLEIAGPTFNVWVDGRNAMEVNDESYQGGGVGLAGYGWYSFRNVRISGAETSLENWDRRQTIPAHHFTVGLNSDKMPSGCVAPNGDVLLAAGNRLVRSKDKGRTWGEPESLPEQLGDVTDYGNTMFTTSQGRLLVMTWRNREETEGDVPEVAICESKDNGGSWSDPVPGEVASGWPKIPPKLTPYGPILETAGGAWIRFLLGGAGEGSKFDNVVTWSSIHCKAYAIRSTDEGKTWSAPIELDRPSWSGVPRGNIIGSLDLTEPTGVSVGDKVTVLVRPIYSPYMWQCWSYDGGASFDSAARATFPGYAQSMIRTTSGIIVCAHRYPQYSVNRSDDDGLNWDAGTVIDYPAWAMGCLVEVEPDVLLCTYMNWTRDAPLLAQLVRVTKEVIQPVSP